MPVYLIAFLLLCVIGGSVAYRVQVAKYDLLDAKHKAFVAETEAEGVKAAAKADKLKSAYLTITKALEKEREEYHSQTDAAYLEYNRLRRNASTSSDQVRSLTEALQGVDCSSETEARLNRSLEQLETGVLARLGKSRDKAIIDLQVCVKEWTKLANKSAE